MSNTDPNVQLIDLANSQIISSLLDAIGVNYSVIDCNGNYIAQNQSMINDVSKGLLNAEQIDKTSWDDCQLVMKNGVRVIKEEQFEDRYYLSIKQPVLDNEKYLGIIVLSFNITERKKQEKMLEAAIKAKEIAEAESQRKSYILENVLAEINKRKYYLTGEFKNTYLTKREAQCLLCLASGNSSKEIGRNLKISSRTAETHLNNLKVKLCCNNRSQLIAKAIEYQFLDRIRPVFSSVHH